MHNPSKTLRKVARVGLRRRPSAAMSVALVALFVALSGGAYAAVKIPAHSIGATQLKSFAVTNPKLGVNSVGSRKIMPGAVGFYRVNRSEVQLRLKSTCAAGKAITGVDINGNVSCAPSASEINSAPGGAVDVGGTNASVASLSLPANAAATVQANPYITVTPSPSSTAADQHVVVTCTLNTGTASAQRSASFDLPAASSTPAPQVQNTSIPLVVVAPSITGATNALVSCTSSVTDTSGANAGKASATPATVKAQGQIYATELASATTGTTATPPSTNPTPTAP